MRKLSKTNEKNAVFDGVKFEKVIEKTGCVCTQTVGVSMNPFIVMGRDTVFIVKNKSRLKKFDVAFFKRPDGTYVLHRVMKVFDDGYKITGDNAYVGEKVFEWQIIGVMEGYYKKKRYVDCSAFSYRFKTRLWCFPPVRFVGVTILRIIRKIKNLFKKEVAKD